MQARKTSHRVTTLEKGNQRFAPQTFIPRHFDLKVTLMSHILIDWTGRNVSSPSCERSIL